MRKTKIVTTAKLADFMAVHENTIYNWVRLGMPRIKVGNTVRYDLEEVLEWVKERNGNDDIRS